MALGALERHLGLMARIRVASFAANHLPSVTVLLIGLTLGAAAVRAQALPPALAFHKYRLDVWRAEVGVANGLPANNVNFLAQSADGYLWLATPSGLTRFDGLRFELMAPASIPAFQGRLAYLVWPLFTDRLGTMWVTTDRGMVPYVQSRFVPAPPDTALEGEAVQQLAEGAKGSLFGVTVRGSVFRLEGGRYSKIPLPGVASADWFGIAADPDGTLWVARDRSGLVRIQDGVVTRLGMHGELGDDRATCVLRSRDGALWVGTSRGVARIEGKQVTLIHFWGGHRRYNVVAGLQASDGAMWFASEGAGIYRVEQRDRRFSVEAFSQKEGLTDDRAIALLADREGSIWVGTRLGLNRFHLVPFRALTRRDGLPSDAMGAMIRDRWGRLWLAPVAGGLYRGTVVDGRVRLTIVEQPERGRATTLSEARDGTVWAGWGLGGISGYRGQRVVRLGSADGLAGGTVYAIADDRRGGLWVAAGEGLTRFRLSADGLRVRHARTFTAGDGLQENVAMRLWEDSTGAMWVGNAGLSRIAGDSIATFRVADGVAAPIVNAIQTDRQGRIWVGTHGGITRVSQGQLVPLRSDQGLYDEYINAIVNDGLGFLWLAGSQGLARVSQSDLDSVAAAVAAGRTARLPSVTTFGSADGLPGQDAVLDASPGAFLHADGTLWFAMAWGIAVVDPTRVRRDKPAPSPQVEALVVDGAPVDVAPGLELPAGTRRVEVRYSGIDLLDGAGVRFRYRLDGLDTNWVNAGAQRTAAFTQLSPGTYRFRVEARSTRGSWGPSEAAVSFRMLPQIWQRWWFLAGCLVIGVATVIAILQLRQRRMEARSALVIEERTRVARELHDTLLQGFTGITLQLRAIASRRRESPAASTAQLGDLVEVAEKTLSEARHAVWALRGRGRTDGAAGRPTLPDRLERNARDLIGSAPITLEFALAGGPRSLTPEVEEELERIAGEAAANAVRHGMPHRLFMSLVFQESGLSLMIRDDGQGFAPHNLPPGGGNWGGRRHFGLVGMRERAARIGARFELSSAPGEGTSVLVVLPSG